MVFHDSEMRRQLGEAKIATAKPSELIRLALEDLAKVEASPEYEINMNLWHYPFFARSRCAVCLAGAVMAGSLGADFLKRFTPHNWPGCIRAKLKALDEFRMGLVSDAFISFGLVSDAFISFGLDECEGEQFDREITPYENSPERFRAEMEDLAADLEAAGY